MTAGITLHQITPKSPKQHCISRHLRVEERASEREVELCQNKTKSTPSLLSASIYASRHKLNASFWGKFADSPTFQSPLSQISVFCSIFPLSQRTERRTPSAGVRHLERHVLETHDLRRARADNRVDAAQGPLVRGDDQQPPQERRPGHEGVYGAAEVCSSPLCVPALPKIPVNRSG